jgi:hypothetical protein
VQTIDWAPHDKMLHSDEWLARSVMPQFQGIAFGTAASNTWVDERRETLKVGRTQAIKWAREDCAQHRA